MNDRYGSKAIVQNLKKTISRRFVRAKKKLKKPATAAVRTATAIGGLVLLVGSVGVATGLSSSGQFRHALIAMLPFALTEPELPSTPAAIIGYGEIVAAAETSLSAPASGRISEVPVRVGDTVREGATIVRIDDTEARGIVREAEEGVARAELALARADSPTNAPQASPAEKAAAVSIVLDRAYIKISDMFPSLPDVITGLNGILYGGLFPDPMGTSHLTVQADYANMENPAAESMKLRAMERYEDAKSKHNVAIARLRSVPGTPDDATLELVLTEASEAVSALSTATKATNDLYVFLKNHLGERGLGAPPVFRKFEGALSGYSSQLDDQTALFTLIIEDVRVAREGKPETVTVADVAHRRQEAELELREAQNALLNARARLALYDVKAPFDGIVATLEKRVADRVSDGETVATLMTNDMLAVISLDQEEVVRVNPGESVQIALDGSDLHIRGHVAEISAGEKGEDDAVRFVVTIILDADDRLQPGMRVIAQFL